MSEIKNSGTKRNAKKVGASKNESRANFIKTLKDSIRSLSSSPAVNVAALVLLLVAVFGGLRLWSNGKSAAQISFVEVADENISENANAENANYSAPEIFKGEVYSTAVRLREIGALGMAMSLVIFQNYAEQAGVLPDLETVFAAIATRGLLPPGIEIENGELRSAASVFVVRYQTQPVRFEILARPKDARHPALLMRFPLQSFDGRTISYFQSSSAAGQTAPEPFAALDRLVSDGWTIEQWRGEMLPKEANSAQILAEEKRGLGELQTNR